MDQTTALTRLLRFPDLELSESLVVLTIWTTYLVPYLVSGVAISHVAGLMLAATCAVGIWRRTSFASTTVLFTFFLLVALSLISGSAHGATDRFWPEAVKYVIVFVIAYFVGLSVSPKQLMAGLQASPWLCVVLVGEIFLIAGNPFSLDGRLALEHFISSNVLGYLAVLNMAVVLVRPDRTRADYMVVGLLVAIMLMCLSRGALIAFLALIWLRIGILRGGLIFGALGLLAGVVFANSELVQRMLIVEDVLTTGGSGRTAIWLSLLTSWIQTPTAWLFGFGPGSVHQTPTVITTIDAAHSLYIGTLYYWGLAGLLFGLALIGLACWEVAAARPSPERTLARDVLAVLIVNGLVDECFDASQINAISALFFALVVAVIVDSRRSDVAISARSHTGVDPVNNPQTEG